MITFYLRKYFDYFFLSIDRHKKFLIIFSFLKILIKNYSEYRNT